MKKIHYTESIHYEIEKTARVMKLLATQFFTKLNLNITPDEYSALDVISYYNGICQRDLAKIILKDRANTGRILNSLEKKGFINRFVDTKNNRLVRKMKLTKEGDEELKNTDLKLKEHLSSAQKFFSREEIENLQKSIIKFREHIEKLLELNI